MVKLNFLPFRTIENFLGCEPKTIKEQALCDMYGDQIQDMCLPLKALIKYVVYGGTEEQV